MIQKSLMPCVKIRTSSPLDELQTMRHRRAMGGRDFCAFCSCRIITSTATRETIHPWEAGPTNQNPLKWPTTAATIQMPFLREFQSPNTSTHSCPLLKRSISDTQSQNRYTSLFPAPRAKADPHPIDTGSPNPFLPTAT